MSAVGSRTETVTTTEELLPKLIAPQAAPREYELSYPNIIVIGYAHLVSVYGLYLALTVATWKTLIFNHILFMVAIVGITAGVHRLWTHRAYKAKMPLQILLMLMYSVAFQKTAIDWIRNHRTHHRYSDTDADPHNATRGFFFSHIGWLLVKKHPEVIRRGKFVDMSDIYANPVLKFQQKYGNAFIGTVAFVIPTMITTYLFGETFSVSWHVAMLRFVITLNVTSSVNSVAHIWGYKPYDKNIVPVQNLPISFMTFGEGFHNFHHAYPWDYRTSEYGNKWLNFTTWFIDFFSWIGWAYDLKSVSGDIVQLRAKRTGDGTNLWGLRNENHVSE